MAGSGPTNAILAGLMEDGTPLAAAAEAVKLLRGAVVADEGEPAPFIYFPTEGVMSLVGTTSGGATVELAVVGSEGVATLSPLFGASVLPFRVIAQTPARAVRIPTDRVSRLLVECGELHRRVLAYTHHLLAQVTQSAICNRFHNARERLARWLLMTADRAGTRELSLTHEFISYMVGGPRSAVTEAAAELRDGGAITYRRGLIVICDPVRLRDLACECYAVLHTNGNAAPGRLS